MQSQQFSPKQKFMKFSSSLPPKSLFSRAFQAPLKSKIKFQGFSRTSRSSMNPALEIDYFEMRIFLNMGESKPFRSQDEGDPGL